MRSAIMVLLVSVVLFFSGCAMFQPRTAGSRLANLPTTGTQAIFQTLKSNNWLFTLSIIGVGAGFFAFLNGSSKGLQFMAACFIVISLIIGVTKYSAIIAVISMIGTVGLMGYSMWIRKKAIKEIVEGVQLIREEPTIKHDAALSTFQSKATKKIVKKIKTTIDV
ncbi:hypothetical protein LCGC14_0624090 [marine sediment metagenome]|uniref:Lipoprotein n=1 Tax=marine sediment metagenome TaxID=412755 RepID=A0A0F9TQE9_9ZZZZ